VNDEFDFDFSDCDDNEQVDNYSFDEESEDEEMEITENISEQEDNVESEEEETEITEHIPEHEHNVESEVINQEEIWYDAQNKNYPRKWSENSPNKARIPDFQILREKPGISYQTRQQVYSPEKAFEMLLP